MQIKPILGTENRKYVGNQRHFEPLWTSGSQASPIPLPV
jgi:hypothetical protein